MCAAGVWSASAPGRAGGSQGTSTKKEKSYSHLDGQGLQKNTKDSQGVVKCECGGIPELSSLQMSIRAEHFHKGHSSCVCDPYINVLSLNISQSTVVVHLH